MCLLAWVSLTIETPPASPNFIITLACIAIVGDNDGFKDLIGVGNLYDAEVETVRYDAAQGYILLNDGHGKFNGDDSQSLFCNSDMRSVEKIEVNGDIHILVGSNNDKLSIYKLN